MKIIPTNSLEDFLKHLGIILGILAVLFFIFFYVFLPFSTNHGESIKVPKLDGLQIDEAIDLLEDQNLNYEIADCTFVLKKSPDLVLTQYPEGGDFVKSGRKIYLTISTNNPPSIRVPNIVGSSLRSAEQQLLINGLILGEVKEINDPRAKEVIEMYLNGKLIDPDQVIKKGSKIDLVVGNGNQDVEMEMPDIVGKPYFEAQFILVGLNLTIGKVTYDKNSSFPQGTVIKTECASCASEMVRSGDTIDIWVAGEETLEEE